MGVGVSDQTMVIDTECQQVISGRILLNTILVPEGINSLSYRGEIHYGGS